VLPDVNASEYRFTVGARGEVVYGLGAIKGIGEAPVESIVAARSGGGAFRDLFEFCRRIDARKVNKRVLEALIRSGAMDGLEGERPVLMAAMNDAIKAAEQQAHAADIGLLDMFAESTPGAGSEVDVYAGFRRARAWSARERLRGEKETLGLYVTGHPIDDHEAELAQFVRTRIAQLRPDQEPQRVAGLVVGMHTKKSRRGDDIAFVQLDDRTARIDVALFGECLRRSCREHVVKDTFLVVEGRGRHRRRLGRAAPACERRIHAGRGAAALRPRAGAAARRGGFRTAVFPRRWGICSAAGERLRAVRCGCVYSAPAARAETQSRARSGGWCRKTRRWHACASASAQTGASCATREQAGSTHEPDSRMAVSRLPC
jgi:DNA polymerase III alpha subunit